MIRIPRPSRLLACASVPIVALAMGAATVVAAAPAQAAVTDLDQARCGNALVTAKVERTPREFEVDVEVYAGPRERWVVTVKNGQGRTLERITRTTNREGEFDAWRYLPLAIDQVRVVARGPAGQLCTLDLRG